MSCCSSNANRNRKKVGQRCFLFMFVPAGTQVEVVCCVHIRTIHSFRAASQPAAVSSKSCCRAREGAQQIEDENENE